MATNFKTFESRPLNGGIGYTVFYPNGYGASIVQHSFSYGGDQGKWELAVLKGNKDEWSLCYDTDITDDVLGYLTEKEVNSTCDQIAALDKVEDNVM